MGIMILTGEIVVPREKPVPASLLSIRNSMWSLALITVLNGIAHRIYSQHVPYGNPCDEVWFNQARD